MINLLKNIIVDFQETLLETGTPRRLKIQTVPDKATICIGVRRSGKSTYLFQIMEKLLDQGISRTNILYLNFFDDRLHDLRYGNLGDILEAYYSLFPEKKTTERIYCFFDEIQDIPGWEAFVDRLMRTEKCEVYITGSSARLLSKEIATQMRGRALSWEIFPFSFQEALDMKNIEHKSPLSTKKQLLVRKAFEEYWQSGGFPEVIGLDRSLRIKIHQEYFNSLMFRDLIERHDISHPKALTDLSHWLINNAASLYTINSLTGYLKSLGHKAPKSAISEYLEWFEDAFFLFTVRLFDASLTRANANPKKIYCIDHALVTSTASGILLNSGHLLENLVFLALRRMSADIFYYKCKSGKEVDFTVLRPDSPRMLVQVCTSLADPRTRKREVAALIEAMKESGLQAGTIVTLEDEEQIHLETGDIHVIPAWRFLLTLSEEME